MRDHAAGVTEQAALGGIIEVTREEVACRVASDTLIQSIRYECKQRH